MYKETFAGLDNPDCVLQDIQIEADLYETLAKVSTTHQYVNNGAVNIEAVYTFPLPSDAVLLDMNLVVGDRKLIGQIIPKKQAEDRYEDAVVDGDLPAMIQNPSHGIYTLNIANIQPGEHVAISFTYGMFLMWQGHDLRFTIPTTIASRYGDPEKAGLVDHQIPETDFLTENRYSMKIRVHGQMASAVIASPSHDINMELLDDSVLIHFAQSSALMDRDFVLNLSVSNMNKSSLMWGLDGNSHLLWACFHPHFGNQPDEGSYGLILVVDCSGSMAGDSINQARSASRNVLKTLRKQDYFNIVAFGSGHKTLFRKMKPADQDNLEEAMDFVKDLQADMGGTEMESALKNALGFICKAVLSQDILLITDGEVWDIDGAVKLASKKNHRIFSIGVGSSPAESNLKKLSTRTGGACEFVFPGESMNEKILRHAGRICSPVIQKIDMVWPSLPDQVFPGTLETLFDGDTVNVFGRFANRVESGEVGLSLIMADGQAIDVSAGDVSTAGVCKEPGLIARMAAATKLADMTDPDDATALSVKYQLICKYTHCLAIAIQAEGEKAVTLPEIRRVKQMHAAGWGAMGKVRDLAPCMVSYESRDLNYILEGDLDDLDQPTFIRRKSALSLIMNNNRDLDETNLSDIEFPLSYGQAGEHSLSEFANFLNQYDIKLDPKLLNIFDHLPTTIQEIINLLCLDLPDSDFSSDDLQTVFLHLYLQSDYGNQLNRNVTRIIKKRFKEAKLPLKLVKQISNEIEPIFNQNEELLALGDLC